MKKHLPVLLGSLLVILSAAFAGAGFNPDPGTLTVALLPDRNAARVINRNRPLKDYLEKQLGKKIRLVVAKNYTDMIRDMKSGVIQVGYFGPFIYVQAKAEGLPVEVFAALSNKGETTYESVVIAGTGLGIKRLEDIGGLRMAFGDPKSTSAHLVPEAMLAAKGLLPGRDYRTLFLGTHEKVARAVQSGRAAAGGMSRPIYREMKKKSVLDSAKVKILEVSPPFPQYPWTMRSDLDPDLKASIRKAFLSLDDPKVLEPFEGATGFGPMNDSDYRVVREPASLLNLHLNK